MALASWTALVGAAMASSPPVWTLARAWVIGGAADETIYGVIADCARGADGRTYVLDQQLAVVRVIDERGVTAGEFAGWGEGPGEFSDPRAIEVLADGRVAILQPSPPRLSAFDADGVYRGELPCLPRNATTGAMAAVDGGLVLRSVASRFDADGMAQQECVGFHALTGGATVAYCQAQRRFGKTEVTIHEAQMYPFVWAAAADRVAIAEGWHFAINELCLDGQVLAALTEGDAPQVRSTRRREAIIADLRAGGGADGARIEDEDTERDVRWLGLTSDRVLWVLTSEGAHAAQAGQIGRFKVYDPTGAHRGDVILAGEGSVARDRLILDHDHLFVLRDYEAAFANWRQGLGAATAREGLDELGSDEQMSVLCYRMPTIEELWPSDE